MDHDPRPTRPPAADLPPEEPPARMFLHAVDEPGSLSDEPSQPLMLPSYKGRALVLFLATCASTFVVGMFPGYGIDPFFDRSGEFLWSRFFAAFRDRSLLLNGFQYSAAVIGILLTHEMGHYVQSRRHRVPATLPFFIPIPIPFGTMGAVILQGAGFADRRKLFDIAISGPLAGLVIAIPVTWMGVRAATADPLPANFVGVIFNDPLLIRWIAEWIHPEYGPGYELSLNPLLFAGWVGIFVTALNLIPVGQLDGGHILYTLIGKPAHYVALGVLGVAIAAMFWFEYPAFALLVVLLVLMGPRHPPTADDTAPLGPVRIALGWLTLAFVLIGFTPQPIIELNGRNEKPSTATAEANP